MSLVEKLEKPQAHGTPLAGFAPLGRVARAVLSTLFSFEMLFVLYLFAGRYKADPRFQWVPVDLTALFLALSILVGISVLWRRRFKVRRKAFELVLLALAFVAYVIASLVWTPGQVYARQKALYISTLTLWCLVACAIIIAQQQCRLKRFLVLVWLFSIWVAVESTLAYFRPRVQLGVFALGGNYLGLGRTVGLGLLIVLAYRLFFAHGRTQKLAASVLLGYYAFVMLVLGGRGPFLATLAGALVLLWTGMRLSVSGSLLIRRYVLLLIIVGGIFSVVIAYLMSTGAVPVTLSRLLEFFKSMHEGSAGVRWKLFGRAIILWSEAPVLGHGIGAFPVRAGFGDLRSYPHNLILEVLVELGLVGLLLLCAVFFYAFKGLGPLSVIRRDPLRILILMLLANVLTNAMLSGDIPDNRILFGVLGLMTLPEAGGKR